MKILIIGSKGFIGSHCEVYFRDKHQIYSCDVVVDYEAERYFQIDATNASYEAVFEAASYDVCINCSGAANVQDSITNPQRDFQLNTNNVFKQLDALRKYNPHCKYINLSSAAVYGNPKYLPIDEQHPINPISPYGVHKKIAEQICNEFYHQYKVATVSLRIFSAYGPGLKKQLFWDLYKKSSLANVLLFGTGQESRDFIYISDVVKAIDMIIHHHEFSGTVINVANGIEWTIAEVANHFFSSMSPAITYSFSGEERKGDPSNWVADISKLKSLGYTNGVSLEEGINKYWKWLNENR